jgi:subtilisin family serine protease
MRKFAILRKPNSHDGHLKSLSGPQSALTFERLPEKAFAEMLNDPSVDSICPVMPTRLIKPMEGQASETTLPWGLEVTGVDRSPYSGRGVKVAVLDTGIERDHPAFAGVNLIEQDFTDTGNGDHQGHGTHCAGTIFGRDVQGKRIGVARGVEAALIGKVLRDDGSGESEMVFNAMHWAMAQGANVVSMSLGFDFPGMVAALIAEGWPADLATSTALEAYRGNMRMFDAIMGMYRAQAPFGGSPLVIAAAGNESRRELNPEYRIAVSLPAAADDVISVAALGQVEQGLTVASFSNSLATVSAPGVDIVSAGLQGSLKSLSGTSMACPHVAGIAALWWEQVRTTGKTPSAINIKAMLLAHTSRETLGTEVDEADIGQGIVMAPL